MLNRRNAEFELDQSDPQDGIRVSIRRCFRGPLDGATPSVPITASTTPELIQLSGVVDAIKYDHGDTAANTICFKGKMPEEYATQKQDLIVSLFIRKNDATDENTDLQFQADVSWMAEGDSAVQSITTVAKTGVLETSGTALTDFHEYEIDLGARLRAEGKVIEPGAQVVIAIGPDDTVGTTDMDVEVGDIDIRARCHIAAFTRTKRGSPIRSG